MDEDLLPAVVDTKPKTFEEFFLHFFNDGKPKVVFTAIENDIVFLRIYRGYRRDDDATAYSLEECLFDEQIPMKQLRGVMRLVNLSQTVGWNPFRKG